MNLSKTYEDWIKIMHDYNEGMPFSKIASRVGLPEHNVSRVINSTLRIRAREGEKGLINDLQNTIEGIKTCYGLNSLGEISDGYHTFNELYHHRAVLFGFVCNANLNNAWKSKKHHDGTMYDGMFIVGIDTPYGQVTYHYDIEPYWDTVFARVHEIDNAPEWDGHTPEEAIKRIEFLSMSFHKND